MNSDEAQIRQFMGTQFLFDFDDSVTPDSNLFQLGLIDSFGFVELVSFLEREFQVRFSDEELVDGTLNSLANIVASVRSKRHG